MKKKAIIVDLDGTLCNIDHRLHHFTAKKKNWKAFFEGIPNDTINPWCRTLIYAMDKVVEIIFVSGRPDEYRGPTKNWLAEYGFGDYPLFMRPSGDFRRDSEIKEEIYRKHIEPNYDVSFVVDDRQHVVDKWREMGLTCLQCAKGDY